MKNQEKENPNKFEYTINEDKTVSITSGEFAGVKIFFSNFELIEDKEGNLVSYDYSILQGDVAVNQGEEIKAMMRIIINDVIENFQPQKEE